MIAPRGALLRLLLSPAFTLGCAVAPAPSAAAESAAAPSRVAPQVARCTALAEDATRLACYDALFRATPQSAEAGFGLEGREPPPAAPLETIASPIATLERLRDGHVRVTLENGQVWRQTDGPRQTLWRVGDRLLVERAPLGSFVAAGGGSGRHVRVSGAR